MYHLGVANHAPKILTITAMCLATTSTGATGGGGLRRTSHAIETEGAACLARRLVWRRSHEGAH